MRKTFTAGLTALSLVLIPATPLQAETNDGLNRAIVGLLAAGAIAAAINHNQDSTPAKPVAQRHDPRTHNNSRQVRNTRRADPLPSRCFRQIELRGGRTQSVFTESCLDRRYSNTAALPQQCITRLGGNDGSRRGYEASCLRERGFRTDQRW